MIKKTLLILAATACAAATHASAQMLTISEVYGGGGNGGSTYSNDFIELYNYGTTTIDMSVYALYYAAATSTTGYNAATAAGTTNNFTTTLTGTLAAGSYYLVAEAQGTAGTKPLTNVNAVGTINLSSTAGKVALGLASTTPTYSAGAITAANNTIDFVGYGTTANQYAGAGPAPILTSTTADSKANPPGATVSNSSDYTSGAPSPMGTGTLTAGVPEPSTWVATLGGLGSLCLVLRRRSMA